MITDLKNLKINKNFKNIVLTYGHFNTIHPGHIRYLRHAKEKGDFLIVALLGDKSFKEKSNKFNQEERAEALNLISIADHIVCLENNELSDVIAKINPKILILGNEFEHSLDKEVNKSIKLQRSLKRDVQFHAGEVTYATTDLLITSQDALSQKRKIQFLSACRRQKLTKEKLISSINSWKDTKLIVIGDTILDQYAACEAIGMSAEAPVVVVKELQHRNYIGGAAIVASHIRALGASCDFISVVGNDDNAKLVHEKINSSNIGNKLITDPSRPTTFKKRYIVENQKLFRVSRLEDHLLEKNIENQIIKKLQELAPKANGIVVSDFVYGVVTKKIIESVINLSQKYNLMLFGDLQCSSQMGPVSKFKNFTLLCPNEKEARIALQDKDSGLETLSNRLMERTKSEKLIMKLGSEGFIAYDKVAGDYTKSQSFPSLSVNPVDVSGAGDSLLAVMSTGISTTDNFMSAAAIACCMSAIAVENMGNLPISSNSLKDFLVNIFE